MNQFTHNWGGFTLWDIIMPLFIFMCGAAVPLALFPVVPCIKHIFTSSCVLWAVGWSVLALAILYVITDIWKFRKGMWLILPFGQMALTAYMMHVPPLASGLHALANAFGQGGARILGAAAQPLVLAVVEAVTMIAFMLMYRRFKRAK